jgi:hypothetical protein
MEEVGLGRNQELCLEYIMFKAHSDIHVAYQEAFGCVSLKPEEKPQ